MTTDHQDRWPTAQDGAPSPCDHSAQLANLHQQINELKAEYEQNFQEDQARAAQVTAAPSDSASALIGRMSAVHADKLQTMLTALFMKTQ